MSPSRIANFVDLTEPQRALLEAFERDVDLCQTFYFIGGTLLKALGIVPRISNDIDFFSFPGRGSRTFISGRIRLRGLCAEVLGTDTINDTLQGIIHTPSGMVIDVVEDDIQTIGDFQRYGNLKTASIHDCTANKASALCSRDEIKDMIDIAFLAHKENLLLKDLERFAEKKFGLGTITEEKLLTELLSKRELFNIPADIFLRDGEAHAQFVEKQISHLIEKSSL